MDGVAKRSHEVVGRGANGPIIVDDSKLPVGWTQRSFLETTGRCLLLYIRGMGECVRNQARKIILRFAVRRIRIRA